MNTTPSCHKYINDGHRNDYVKGFKNRKDLTTAQHRNEAKSKRERELTNIYKPYIRTFDNELQLYPLELRPLMDNNFMKNFNENRKRNCCMHQPDKGEYSKFPYCKDKSKCVTTPNVYGNILGPTPDESILTGLQTVIDLCKRIDVCKRNQNVDSSSDSSAQSTILKEIMYGSSYESRMVVKTSQESLKGTPKSLSFISARGSNANTAVSSKETDLMLDKRESSERRSRSRDNSMKSLRNERSYSSSEKNNTIKSSKSVSLDESQPHSSFSSNERDIASKSSKSASVAADSQPRLEKSSTSHNQKSIKTESSESHSGKLGSQSRLGKSTTSNKENSTLFEPSESHSGKLGSQSRLGKSTTSNKESSTLIEPSKSHSVHDASQPGPEKNSVSNNDNNVPSKPSKLSKLSKSSKTSKTSKTSRTSKTSKTSKSSNSDVDSEPRREKSVPLDNGKHNGSEMNKTEKENNIEERRKSGSTKRLTIKSFPIMEVPPCQEDVPRCCCVEFEDNKPVGKSKERKRRTCVIKGRCKSHEKSRSKSPATTKDDQGQSKMHHSSSKSAVKMCPCVDCYKRAEEVTQDNNDDTLLEVRYAITKISVFGNYITYEVLKSSSKKPKKVPECVEGIFVTRR